MSLQDDVLDVEHHLNKCTHGAAGPMRRAFGEIIDRLWQYESEIEDAEATINAQNHLLKLNCCPRCKAELADKG
jgi:hypothetical protein